MKRNCLKLIWAIFKKKINNISYKSNSPENIFLEIDDYIENLGNNPVDETDLLYGPFDTVNRIYGPLLRPQGVNLIGARTGAKKTSL